MQIDILALFPQLVQGLFSVGIFRRAIDQKLVRVNIHNIRDYTHDKHRTVDDYAYGGGAGMILKPEPIFEAAYLVTQSDYEAIVQCGKSSLSPVWRRTGNGLDIVQPRLRNSVPDRPLLCKGYEACDRSL